MSVTVVTTPVRHVETDAELEVTHAAGATVEPDVDGHLSVLDANGKTVAVHARDTWRSATVAQAATPSQES